MKLVSVRQFHRDARFERLAAAGEEVIVTWRGNVQTVSRRVDTIVIGQFLKSQLR